MTEEDAGLVTEASEHGQPVERKLRAWQPLSTRQYRAMAASLVHFSTKAVNTNAAATGVRVAATRFGRELPYAAASTLAAGEVALDFHLSSPVEGVYPPTVARQVNAVREGTQAQHFSSSPGAQELAAIEALVASEFSQAHEAGSQVVSIRVKQILVPDGHAGYLALTPLHSTGLARAINRHRRLVIERIRPAWLGLEPVVLAFGGSNAQNIGLFAHEMRAAMLARAPVDELAMRWAVRFHHRGMAVAAPRSLCEKHARWLLAQRRGHGAVVRDTQEARREEHERVVRMARMVLGLAARIRAPIQPAIDACQLDELISQDLDTVVMATINPSLRDARWLRVFIERVAGAVVRLCERLHGKDVPLGLDDSIAALYAAWIQEELR